MGREIQVKSLPEAERFLSDTHPVIWHLSGDSRLSTEARRRFEMAESGEAVIFLSVISIIEMLYLKEKNKIPRAFWELFLRTLKSDPQESCQIVDLTYDLAQSIDQVPRTVIPEMPDRIIAATALRLNIPMITKDHRLHQWERIVTIW